MIFEHPGDYDLVRGKCTQCLYRIERSARVPGGFEKVTEIGQIPIHKTNGRLIERLRSLPRIR